MATPAECSICGRILPLGGVPDDVGRPVHFLCRGLAKREVAEYARLTAKRVATEGQPPQRADRRLHLDTPAPV